MSRLGLRARRGISLVEVLVAMTILLIGIFALVRVFPYGFTSILYGRNVSMAQALARGVIEVARAQAEQMPEAVVAFNPITLTVFPNLPVNQELTPYQPNPGQAPDTRFSDVNKVRRVLGETTKIPAPTTTSLYMPADGSTGQRLPVSVYFLNFSPIYSADVTRSGLGGVYVYAGNPLNRVVLNGPPDDEQTAEMDANSYGIDYGNATLYFRPVDFPRRFKVEYSFTVQSGANGFIRDQARPDTCIFIPPNVREYDLRQAHRDQPPDCVFIPMPAGARLGLDEDRLFRAFDRLGPNEPFSNGDPYQFRVLNSIVGVIGFNPLGATIRPPGTNSRGILARVDYDVDDWHIIHEDRVVPFSPPHSVKLTLNDIAHIGDVDEYQETYTSLIKSYPDRPSLNANTDQVDMLVVDLDTGLTLDSRTLQRPDDPQANGSNLNGTINYQDGIVRFNDAVQWTTPAGIGPAPGPIPVGGKRVRIYYRTGQDWAVQFTKAFNEYVRENDVTDLGYREYAPGTAGYVFFPIQEHDFAVLVDYTWVHRVNGQDVVRTETGEYHQISDPAAPESPQNVADSPFPYWWIRVDAADRADAVPNSIRIVRVRGVSVRARVIWREGNRWRKLDLDSYVSRDRSA
jgi:type II secretory pathway pseudopilin PulG